VGYKSNVDGKVRLVEHGKEWGIWLVIKLSKVIEVGREEGGLQKQCVRQGESSREKSAGLSVSRNGSG
jgi:hypothetical protein